MLHLIAPTAHPELQRLAALGSLAWEQRPFMDADVLTAHLVIAATDDPAVNAAVYGAARRAGVLANSADDPPHCDFYFPSIVRRGPLQIAISTAGESPAFAQQLRREIESQLPEDLGPALEALGSLRRDVLVTHPAGPDRKQLLHTLAQRPVCDADACPTRRLAALPLPKTRAPVTPAAAPTAQTRAAKGHVYLVGAGPGDPELLTLRALRLLESADILFHDDLVPPQILALAPRTALTISVGKRCGSRRITQAQIHAFLIESARNGLAVLRLKSGDPLLFGRAAEEMDALTEAHIPFTIVPGVTAAFAAAAALNASLPDRRHASAVHLATAHHASHPLDDAARPAPTYQPGTTQVLYMPGSHLAPLAAAWLAQGAPPHLPCALVSRAAQPGQQIQRCRLDELAALSPTALRPADTPSLFLAGEALAERPVSRPQTSTPAEFLPIESSQIGKIKAWSQKKQMDL